MKTFRFDTETYPIRVGRFAPKMVCLQYAFDENAPKILLRPDAADVLHTALTTPDLLLEAHNGAYDQVVTSDAFPDLLPLWFRALGNGRGRDTLVREKLRDNARGTLQDQHPKGWYSLGDIAKRRCGLDLDKSGHDSWRLRYALLDGVPVAEWPAEAVRYAEDDVTALRSVSKSQLQDHSSPDEWFQVAAAFVLNLTTAWGFVVDRDALSKIETSLLTEKAECERLLEAAGFFRDGSVDKKRVQAAVLEAYERLDRPVPRTAPSKTFPEGQVKTDSETLEELGRSGVDLGAVSVLSKHTTTAKMLSTYLRPLRDGADSTVNCSYNVLAATGRTTSHGSKLKDVNPWWTEAQVGPERTAGTNAQNWPQAEGIRDCVVARPGTVLCSVDYNSLELRTLGQVCLWVLGKSTFARGYQVDPDWDPHSYMGGQLVGIGYQDALARAKTDKKFKKGPRALGKALNFSLAGGVGARRFAEMATLQHKAGFLEEPVTEQQAYEYKRAYLAAYPEMVEYFEWAAWLAETGTPLVQCVSKRLRGAVGFTSAANSYFQGLAADLAKRALFDVSLACYTNPKSPLWGSRVVAFVHDEIVLEIPQDRQHEAAVECERLMCAAGSVVAPDVPFRAEAALMTHWIKKAEPRFGPEGKLIPFDS